jgi:anti-sigma28 factor (negative regulator of flagellin synthesis)
MPTSKKAKAATVRLAFPVDAEKAEAIKRCINKGTLTVTMSKADLSRARLGDPYKYD